jgi:hypothetical protein
MTRALADLAEGLEQTTGDDDIHKKEDKGVDKDVEEGNEDDAGLVLIRLMLLKVCLHLIALHCKLTNIEH